MTPDQLRTLRESRGLTREQLASFLGDCSASTVNKWERGINPVPSWVEEKMLLNVKVEFPLADLHALLDYARESEESFEQFLSTAVREFLASRRSKPKAPPVIQGPTPANPAALPSTTTYAPPQSDSLKVADG